MPEFVNYQLQQTPIRQIDTGVVSNALATITAGNKEALQKQSELRAAIANMDLNEAEDEFRQQLYDDITQTIEDNSIEGNAYYALDDIIKKTGDVASNPGLMGRLKAQQAYKTYQAGLDARNDIDQDIRDWAKELNPYHYEDKVDENGRIIGGSEWTPTFTPTSALDMNKIYAIASQYIIPKKGSINTATFVDPVTKNISSTYSPGMALLNTTTGTYEEVTSDMVRNAINMALDANPQFAAQMEQSWRVAKWKHDKEPDMPNPAYEGTRELSFNEYKNNLINPFINSQVRTNRLAQTDWKITTQAEYTRAVATAEKEAAKNNNNAINPFGEDVTGDDLLAAFGDMRDMSGYAMELPTRLLDSALTPALQEGAQVANLLGVSVNELPDNFDAALRLARGKVQTNIPEMLRNPGTKLNFNYANPQFNIGSRANREYELAKFTALKDYYDTYGPTIERFKNPDKLSDQEAIDTVLSVIQNGTGLDNLDEKDFRIKVYKSMYNGAINALFDGDDSATFKTNNDIDSSTARQLRNLGMIVEGNNVTLTKDNPDAAYYFYDFMQNNPGTLALSSKEKQKQNEASNYIITSGGAAPGYVKQGDINNTRQRYTGYNNSYITRVKAPFDAFFNSMKEASAAITSRKALNNYLGIPNNDDPTVLMSTATYRGLSVIDAIYSPAVEMTGKAEIERQKNEAAGTILDLASHGDLIHHDIFIVKTTKDGDDIIEQATPDEKRKITNYLGTLDLKDVKGDLSQIGNAMFMAGLTYYRPIYDDKGKDTHNFEKVQILIGDSLKDPYLDKLNSSGYLQMGKTLTYNWIHDTPTNVGKMGSDNITLRPHKENNSNAYNDLFDIYMGNDFFGTTNSSDAINGTIAYRTLINDRHKYNFGNDDSEISENLGIYLNERPAILNALTKLYGDPETAFNVAYYIITE